MKSAATLPRLRPAQLQLLFAELVGSHLESPHEIGEIEPPCHVLDGLCVADRPIHWIQLCLLHSQATFCYVLLQTDLEVVDLLEKPRCLDHLLTAKIVQRVQLQLRSTEK